MGFGTLLIGHFLLLNVTYYAFTDLIAALIMALALTKLSGVNSYFRYGSYAALGFAALGLSEFVLEAIRLFAPNSALTLPYLPILRSGVVLALTLLILLGIRDVAKEVDLPKLAARADRMIPTASVIYILTALLDTPSLFSGIEPIYLAAASLITLFATLFLIIYNLITVFCAYSGICMPEDLELKDKPSRFGFVNKFREYEDKKYQEYADYRLEKHKKQGKKK